MFTLGRNTAKIMGTGGTKKHMQFTSSFMWLSSRCWYSANVQSLHLTSLWYVVGLQTTENQFSTTVSTSLILIPVY